MAVNKVVINGDTKIDLSSDTVTQEDVLTGVQFHDSTGLVKTGTYNPGETWTAILRIKTDNPNLFSRPVSITKVTN